VTASPKPGPARRQTHPGWRQAVAASWFARHAAPGKAGQRTGNRDLQLSPAVGVAAVMAWRRVLQAPVVQFCHRTKVGAVWRQPSRALWQRPPAVTVTAAVFSGGAALHRPLGPPQPVQLRRQQPGAVLQVLQVGVAVERPPVNVTCPAAPVAGLRSARTGVVGLRPASATAGLVQPRAGRDGDLPGPARLPAAHEASPPLAWLPGSDQPTKPAGTAKPEPHRGSTVLPAGRACRARSWAGRVLGRGSLPADQVGVGPPYPCALARQVWPVDQAISPSPRASRDVAGGKPQGDSPGAARARPPAAYRHGGAGHAPSRSSPGSAPLAENRAWAGQADPSDRDATSGSASSVGIGRRLAAAQATLPEPCRHAPLDA
jgi:hypothetical protein